MRSVFVACLLGASSLVGRQATKGDSVSYRFIFRDPLSGGNPSGRRRDQCAGVDLRNAVSGIRHHGKARRRNLSYPETLEP
jgi:hypothetical protein